MDGYDSDDYEDVHLNSSNASVPGPQPSSQQRGNIDLAFDHATTYTPRGIKRRKTTQAISSGFNIFLLFGAAIDRCVSRAQAAMLAACAAALAVLKHIARSGANKANQTKLKAQKSFMKSPAGQKIDQWRRGVQEIQQELPDDTWGKLMWLWDRPPVQRLRLTVSMFNLSFRLPALMALVATQVGLLASQVSLPMLAPLLLGTGMLLRSIKTNASFLFPRIGLLVVMLWMLWFANSVVQNTVAYLRKQGALDNRLAGGIITVSEVSALLVALVVLLSMLGVNVSALLLPAGIAVAIAAKDLSHNFLAGFFLFVVQPFKLGDRIAVSSSAPGVGSGLYGPMGSGMNAPGWFEGVCERVDLRYTVVRQGRKKLVIPNSAFLTREFMIVEDGDAIPTPMPGSNGMATTEANQKGTEQQHQQMQYVPFLTNDHRHVWQYVQGPPLHQELAAAGYGQPVAVPQSHGVIAVQNATEKNDASVLQQKEQHDDNNDKDGGGSSGGDGGGQSNGGGRDVGVTVNSTNGKNGAIDSASSATNTSSASSTPAASTNSNTANTTTTTTTTTTYAIYNTNGPTSPPMNGYWTRTPAPPDDGGTLYNPMTMGYTVPGSMPMNYHQGPDAQLMNTSQVHYYSTNTGNHGNVVRSHPLSPDAWQQSTSMMYQHGDQHPGSKEQ